MWLWEVDVHEDLGFGRWCITREVSWERLWMAREGFVSNHESAAALDMALKFG